MPYGFVHLAGVGLAVAALLAAGATGCDSASDEAATATASDPFTGETAVETPGETAGETPGETPGEAPGETPAETPQAVDCVSDTKFFAQRVWEPLMGTKCIACHNSTGAAKHTKLILQTDGVPGFLDHNFETVRKIAAFEYQGKSLLLIKPLGELSHGGGEVIKPDSEEYAALEEMVKRFADPTECEDDPGNSELLDDIALYSPLQTFRKAALGLADRLPLASESAGIEVGGEAALAKAVRGLLDEDAFYAWLKESFNDLLLTERYNRGDDAIDLLDEDRFPNARWYEMEESSMAEAMKALGAQHTNRAVAQDALELIAFIVRNDRPFTEVLTADYVVVNPFSAVTFGVADQVTFDDATDPNEFRMARVEGIPHAGVLTSPMFLNRFPTTATNRNRHRSRMIMQFFLALDIMKLAARPLDPTSIEDHNPTMFNPDCAVCHVVMDPLAGALQNWTADGRYLPPEGGWHQEMRPPGFGEAVIPFEERGQAARAVAKLLVADERFATAGVVNMFNALVGRPPLSLPASDINLGDYDARLRAYEAEKTFVEAVAAAFVDSGYDLKVVITEIILSRYYRADEAVREISEVEQDEVSALATSRLLTPEQLSRRVETVTGYPWRASATKTDYLLDRNVFRIFYGGIDSDTVIKRITEPNGVMVSVAQRMANEMSCAAVPRDFTKAPASRLLFPYVELGFLPEDANGFEVPRAIEAIKENIRHLHWHVLGQVMAPGDPEIDRTYSLFYDTWKEGRDLLRLPVEEGGVNATLAYPCRAESDWWSGEAVPAERQVKTDGDYTVRAWMAVVTYLLSDYDFLYE